MRIIKLNEVNKITNVRYGSDLLEGEIPSETGLMGQIMTSDRVFENDIYVSESDLKNKLVELDVNCTKTIYGGFLSSVKYGEERLYGFMDNNQINLEAIKNNLLLGLITEYEYYAEGYECDVYSKEDLLTLYSDAMTFKLLNIRKYKLLSTQAKSCTLKSELEAIKW